MQETIHQQEYMSGHDHHARSESSEDLPILQVRHDPAADMLQRREFLPEMPSPGPGLTVIPSVLFSDALSAPLSEVPR